MTVHLHQIAWKAEQLESIEPGYQVLDNTANERPDWYEYHPIRRHLQATALDDADWYGFFSPKFGAKTGLSCAQVEAAVQAAAPGADVVLFSPQPDMGACFLNVFEQGETFDPGFIAACESWLGQAGLLDPAATPLRSLVMDSRQVVFSNYFVARPAFWREWLRWNESLHALCESGPDSIRAALVQPTSYPGGAQRKVFIQERTASLILTVQPQWRTHAVNPFRMGWSTTRLRDDPGMVAASDALKRAYRDFGWPCYLQAYAALRERFRRGAAARPQAAAPADRAQVASPVRETATP